MDFATARLMVRRAVQFQTGKGMIFIEPKTRSSRRTLAVPPLLLSVLQNAP